VSKELEALELIRSALFNGNGLAMTNECNVIEKALGASQWRPIEEAPKDGSNFLGIGPSGNHVIMHWMRPSYFRDGDPARWFPISDATHFMPLPDKPESETEGGSND